MKQKPPHTVEALQSEAFMEHAIEHHRGAVLRLALARTHSATDAQDIAQDVFIKLLRSATRFHDDDHLRAWLLRATHDSCIDLHRQAWRRRVETHEDMAAVADRETWDPAIEEVVNHPVWTAMERLPDKLRCALHLHYVEGYGIAEVAASWDARRRQPARACIADARSWPPSSRDLKQRGPRPPLRTAQPRTRTNRPTPQCSRPHIREEPRRDTEPYG